MSTLIIRLLFLMLILAPLSLRADEQSGMKLERVVIVSRHGVRAPTKFTPLCSKSRRINGRNGMFLWGG